LPYSGCFLVAAITRGSGRRLLKTASKVAREMPLASAEGHSSCRKAEKSTASEATGSGSAANAIAGAANAMNATSRRDAFQRDMTAPPTLPLTSAAARLIKVR